MKTILLVEDELLLATAIRNYFIKENYIVDVANYFEKAIEMMEAKIYDICIFDIKLADGNGNNLISFLKKNNYNSGIIVISSNNLTSDKIKSLDLGADDYLVKPFDLQELHARIRSVKRRKLNRSSEDLDFNEITVLTDDFTVKVNDAIVALTKKEFELLVYMMINKNRLITKESLAHHLWGNNLNDYDNYDYIYAHVKNLRRKLVSAGSKDYVKNVHGIGYKFTE